MRTLLLILLLATSMSARANDDYFSGYQLLKFCELQDKQLCYGYMLGFRGGWDGAHMFEKPRCRFMNSPENATAGQMALVFIKWAKENPERLHEHAGVGVFGAFSAAWPCPKL